MKSGTRLLVVAACAIMTAFISPALAGRIVAANDDWTLSDVGFGVPNNPGAFALNVASWFTGGTPGNFLVYSDHFGLTGALLQNTMTSAGHGWTIDASMTLDLPTLLAYDGVFLGATAVDNGLLTAYVNAGGNVYLMSAGNIWDPPMWNAFLGDFGLRFENQNSFVGNIPIVSTHPLFAGVDYLYNVNGSSLVDLDPLDPRNELLVTYNGEWIYAIFDGVTVPAPGAFLLVGIGAGLIGCLRRREAQ